MKTCIFFILIFTASQLIGQEKNADALVNPKIAKRVVSVGDEKSDIRGFTNRSIQLAIDYVAKTGGTVKLSKGIFEIESPVRLASNIHLTGAGKETILKKMQGFQTKFIIDADYGELKLTVENASDFEIGMKIQVTDDLNNSCWNVSTAYITAIDNNIIYIDKGLIRDYRSDKNGLVSNASSVIEVLDSKNVTVSNLTADGNREKNFFADGCNSAGILILRSEKITVDNVWVKDFNGEGISWQITENVSIVNSEVSGSGNTGLHPGTGSPFSLIQDNNIHHNDRDGLFICWRVYDSKVIGNQFHNNGRFGICTGHKDTDVLFENNRIYENKSDGVHLRGERESNAPHRNSFVKNTIENNGTDGGAYGFLINSPAKELLLKENTFGNSKGTQKAAIFVQKGGLKPELINNKFDNHELGNVVFED